MKYFFKRIIFLSLIFLSFFSKFLYAETLCARVKIEIQQEVTLERQAFEATMRITNTLDTFPINDLQITVNFEDADGNTVIATSDPNHPSAKFFIRLDAHNGVSGLSTDVTTGKEADIVAGTISPTGVGEIRWLNHPGFIGGYNS